MTARLRFRDEEGPATTAAPWLHRAGAVDLRVLDVVVPPVLDVGCGPGRHCEALAARGEIVLGIDITPHAVDVARRRNVSVLERSVFERVPGAGRWATVLLLDGNVGIGGQPALLLERCAALIRSDGRIIVELDADASHPDAGRARLELGARVGPWFEWCAVSAAQLSEIAARVGLRIAQAWSDGGRCFAVLRAQDRT